MPTHPHNFPKLHNAAWPGVVGKEPGTDNPPIDLETMLDYTANAQMDGQKFDGVDSVFVRSARQYRCLGR